MAPTEGTDEAPGDVWDQALGRRIQPLFSAMFHDLMTPLAILDSNLFLAARHAEKLLENEALDESERESLQQVLHSASVAREAGKRVTAALRIPRDAIWRTVREGDPFDVGVVVEAIGAATKSPAAEAAPPADG